MRNRLAMFAMTMTVVMPAVAQEADGRQLGAPGIVAIGGERLIGVSVSKLELSEKDNADDTAEVESTDVGLLVTRNGRVAFDVFVAPSISVGGTLGYHSEDVDQTSDINDLGDDSSRTTKRIVLSPRIGFLYWASPNFGIWPRVGFAYTKTETEVSNAAGDGQLELSAVLVGADVMAVIPFAPRAAFTAGPGFGYAFSGSADANGESLDLESGSELSLTGGILGWF